MHVATSVPMNGHSYNLILQSFAKSCQEILVYISIISFTNAFLWRPICKFGHIFIRVVCMYRTLALLLCASPIMLWTLMHVKKMKFYFVPLEFCMPKCEVANPVSLCYNRILASPLQSSVITTTHSLRFEDEWMCASILRGGISLLVWFLIIKFTAAFKEENYPFLKGNDSVMVHSW